MTKFFKKISPKTGFTLIELLVVIAIIGVLASIVLASLNNARKKSRDARRITDIKQIQLALELYFDGQSNHYPQANTSACVAPASPETATAAFGLGTLVVNNYIPQVPRDPLSATSCYKYSTPTASAATPTTYHLGASLEDPNHPALQGDKDSDTSSTDTNGFNGADTAGCAAEVGRACYDVTP